MKKYKRINQDAALGGVLGGLAYMLGMQVWILRLVFVLVVLFSNFAVFGTSVSSALVVTYILVALCAPEYEKDPKDYKEVCE